MSKGSPRVATCPECYTDVRFRQSPYKGQVKLCPDCDTELIVTSVSPLKLGYAEDEVNDDMDLYDDDYDGDDERELA